MENTALACLLTCFWAPFSCLLFCLPLAVSSLNSWSTDASIGLLLGFRPPDPDRWNAARLLLMSLTVFDGCEDAVAELEAAAGAAGAGAPPETEADRERLAPPAIDTLSDLVMMSVAA